MGLLNSRFARRLLAGVAGSSNHGNAYLPELFNDGRVDDGAIY
jgi:hypothetical protein